MARPIFRLAATLLSATFVGAVGCGSESKPAADPVPVLQDLTTNVFLPTLRNADTHSTALAGAAKAFAAAPSRETLTAAREAWRRARAPWKRSEAFAFGPGKTEGLAVAIDSWPAKPSAIEAALADTQVPMTPEGLDGLGAGAKGLLALEFLFWGEAHDDDAALSPFEPGTATEALVADAPPRRRRAYVDAAAELLQRKVHALAQAWEPNVGGFATEIASAPGKARAYPNAKAAVDEILNQMLFASEEIVRTKVGKPAGKYNGGTVQPDLEETPRSDNSLADMLETLHGVAALYVGASGSVQGKGIRDLVRAKSPSLDGRMIEALKKTEGAIAAVPQPFRLALTADPASVEAAYQASNSMKKIIASEIAGVLGTTLKFNDNDGD